MDAGFNSQLGQTDFLNLLTVQLQYQDPLDPVAQDTFISQLSQFSTLEGIEKLNASFEQMLQLQQITQGLGLVGRTVTFQNYETGQLESGPVDQITVIQGDIFATINGKGVALSQIAAVKAE